MKDANIHAVMRILRKEVRRWPVPAIGHYADTPFKTLVSCVLSLRTRDRTTVEASERLFAEADRPESLARLRIERLERLIYPVSFYKVKSRTLRRIARVLIERYDGRVPDRIEDLLSLPGVGRKTANIVVTLAYGKPGVAVDTHVHRISNRLGYVATRSAEATELVLRAKLPRRYWIIVNDLFVAFGQNLCTPLGPRCSVCPVARYCDRMGVGRHR